MKLVVLTLIALVASISGAPSESRIAGGTIVSDPAKSYYIVALTDVTTGNHICSGWIYSSTWIVTTAKCVAGKTAANLKVTVGMTNQLRPNPDQADYTPKSIVTHPSFNSSTLLNDIALLEVPAINFSNNVYYLYYDEEDTTITAVKIMGWGTSTDGGIASLRLREGSLVTVPLSDPQHCTAFFKPGYDNNYMICARSPPIDATVTAYVSPCQYDEGSPLVQAIEGSTPEELQLLIIGMYSRNLGCPTTTTQVPPPSVFTRIASYFSWLKTVAGMQALPTTTPPTVPTAPCSPGPCTG